MASGLGLEATELRLGLPGAGGESEGAKKRGYEETIDLKLQLQTPADAEEPEEAADNMIKKMPSLKNVVQCSSVVEPEKPPASKAQVMGWPPVRSFRKNILSFHPDKGSSNMKEEGGEKFGNSMASFMKVSMDGAPYLRKVDLKMYKSYQELSMALQEMFGSFTNNGNCGLQLQGMSGRDSINESEVMNLLYVPTYEDKDGDWMLVGDVPWEMFVDSCKRLRIMKGSETIGLAAPRALEKCKKTN